MCMGLPDVQATPEHVGPMSSRSSKTSCRSLEPEPSAYLTFFFFQAEDGIRDVAVTGVQTCALPICAAAPVKAAGLQMTLVAGEAHRLDGQTAPQPLEHFRGRRLHAVAGIGNPVRFFRELRARGLDIIEHPFPDHHAFAAGEVTFADELSVLMTEKDAVKCRAFGNPRHWYVPVAAEFSVPHARELLDRVVRKLGSFSCAGG